MPTKEEIVNGAIKILEEEGWIKGQMWEPDGYCVFGALDESISRHVEDISHSFFLDTFWKYVVSKYERTPTFLNDNVFTTKEEAIKLLAEYRDAG